MPLYAQGELVPNGMFCKFLKWSLSGPNSSNTFLHITVKNVLKLIKLRVGKHIKEWEFSLIIGRSGNWYKHLGGNLVLLHVLMFVLFDPVVILL